MTKKDKNLLCTFSILWVVLLLHMTVLSGIAGKLTETRKNVRAFIVR